MQECPLLVLNVAAGADPVHFDTRAPQTSNKSRPTLPHQFKGKSRHNSTNGPVSLSLNHGGCQTALSLINQSPRGFNFHFYGQRPSRGLASHRGAAATGHWESVMMDSWRRLVKPTSHWMLIPVVDFLSW
ncbi:hypothetical protein BaRGS_00003952 [Batillaria attramentaria]|uniref:Uncharacterized protein n=1 Tax=Batillaria attramentaria TaxID=370345 RepID=A0ABD0M0U0_9CAEN